jgi:hypothetical protein
VISRRDAVGGQDMLWLALFIGASAMVGGYASYATQQAAIPKLQHLPGTSMEVVQACREAVIPAAQTHASALGAELVRVDATSAGAMRRSRQGQSAPVEVGIVYARPRGRESRQGIIECHVDQRGRAIIANFAGAAG